MAKIKSVEELDVFKRAHKLTLRIYELSRKFPVDEKFGVISQMRRAAASIPVEMTAETVRHTRLFQTDSHAERNPPASARYVARHDRPTAVWHVSACDRATAAETYMLLRSMCRKTAIRPDGRRNSPRSDAGLLLKCSNSDI